MKYDNSYDMKRNPNYHRKQESPYAVPVGTPIPGYGGVKNAIATCDVMVTSIIDFICFVKEIGGTGNAKHLLDAWLIYSNLQYSGAVYRPSFINHDKVFPKNREGGVWHDRQALMSDLINTLDEYANLEAQHSDEHSIQDALVAADSILSKTETGQRIRQGKGRYGYEVEE